MGRLDRLDGRSGIGAGGGLDGRSGVRSVGRSHSLKTLFLASGNRHKIEELTDLLRPLGMELRSTLDVEDAHDVEEDQPTLEGNALKKARYWHRETGLPALADDTGLEVEALDGAPGVYSARYAGENVSYGENVEKLLREMAGKQDRRARFRTVLALVTSSGEFTWEGVCSGVITDSPVGNSGFGYDPVFKPEGYEATFAELPAAEKNRISHRGRALQAFAGWLMSEGMSEGVSEGVSEGGSEGERSSGERPSTHERPSTQNPSPESSAL